VSQAVELVLFTVRPEQEEEFVAERPAMPAAMRSRFPGLEQAFLARRDDGSWLDVVVWSSRPEAEAAAAGMGEVPEAARWASHIVSVERMEHAEIPTHRAR
jgi:hypothetical protein